VAETAYTYERLFVYFYFIWMNEYRRIFKVVGQGVRANWQWINDSPDLKFPFSSTFISASKTVATIFYATTQPMAYR
jgi:hypothetical protein